jgi:hypothetical protein
LSFASEGIQQACQKSMDWPKQVKTAVITNAFLSSEFVKPNTKTSDVFKLVWFSQNINPGRGLEEVFRIAPKWPDFEFHLVGKANSEFIKKIQPGANVIIHPPMPQEDLHLFLSNMDIGLALENPEADGNRNWCLTNKILAYVQAGLYVLATDTYGQDQFLNTLGDDFGRIIKTTLKKELETLDKEKLRLQNKVRRWEKAKTIAWETEAEKLLHLLT